MDFQVPGSCHLLDLCVKLPPAHPETRRLNTCDGIRYLCGCISRYVHVYIYIYIRYTHMIFLSEARQCSSTSQESMPSFHVGFASAHARDFFGSPQKAHSLSVECKHHTGASRLSRFYRASLLPLRSPRVASAVRNACSCTPTSQLCDAL
jgi:hypothetical protein